MTTAHHPEQDFYDSLVAKREFTGLINSSQYGLRADDDEHILLAVNACVDIGDEAIPHLIEALDSFAIDARMAVAQQFWAGTGVDYFDMLLDSMGAFRVDREIRRRLRQGAPHPCQPPALALVRIGLASVQPLIDYLTFEKDWISREAAVWALGELRAREALPCIRGIAKFLRFDRLSRAARDAMRKIKR